MRCDRGYGQHVRSVLLAVAVLGLSAAPAAADIRLIDPANGASKTLVKDDFVRLLGPVGDGFAVHGGAVGGSAVVGVDGTVTPAPQRKGAESVGPAGHGIMGGYPGFELRAPDGQLVATHPLMPAFYYEGDVAWSADGALVAVASDDELRVIATATGALRRQGDDDGRLSRQAFAPDDSALVIARDGKIVRFDIASGQATALGKAASAASWSSRGQVALTRDHSVAVLGAAGVEADVDTAHAAQWSPDGRLLAFGLEVSQGACSYPHVGVAVAAPGAKPRVLVEPTSRALVAYAWSTDGRLAVDREADFTSDKRGKRHPWPKRVASDYHMVSRAGDAAIRRAMLRVARSLKGGTEREPVLARMRRDMAPVQDRYDEVEDTIVRDTISVELDSWLRAAGFEGVESADEFMC